MLESPYLFLLDTTTPVCKIPVALRRARRTMWATGFRRVRDVCRFDGIGVLLWFMIWYGYGVYGIDRYQKKWLELEIREIERK